MHAPCKVACTEEEGRRGWCVQGVRKVSRWQGASVVSDGGGSSRTLVFGWICLLDVGGSSRETICYSSCDLSFFVDLVNLDFDVDVDDTARSAVGKDAALQRVTMA
jgi:hypothetical protein